MANKSKKLNEDEMAYLTLIKKGVLIKKKLPSIPISNDVNREYYTLSDEFRKSFLDDVFLMIDNNVKMHTKYLYDMIIKKIQSYPDELKNKYIIKAIDSLLKQNTPYVLDDETKKCMVLDFYSYSDYLDYYDGNKKIFRNNHFVDFIEEEARVQTIELLKSEYNTTDKSTDKSTQNQVKSYVWLNNPDEELAELYKLLHVDYKLIAPDTSLEQLKSIFTGQSVENINPVKWHDENASELLYFVNKLTESGNIQGNPKRLDYDKLKCCFVKPDGSQFTQAFKSLKQNLSINISNHKIKTIENIVSNFL